MRTRIATVLLAVVPFLVVLCSCGAACPPEKLEAGRCPPPTCEAYCARGREIGCAWAKPTGEGASCETVCAHVQRTYARMNLACRLLAPTCAAAEACD